MLTRATQPNSLAGAVSELFKTTAHLPKLSDTAPLGVYVHDAIAPLYVEKYLGVEGLLKAAFVRPEMELRIELWQRNSPGSESSFPDTNVRVILESSGTLHYWDLGPSVRRGPGGALLSVGGFEETGPFEIGQRRYLFRALLKVLPNQLEAEPSEDMSSCFEMVPQTKQLMSSTWNTSEGDAEDYFRCAVEYASKSRAPQLSITTHGWQDASQRQIEISGRLFRIVENSFRPYVSDSQKIFD